MRSRLVIPKFRLRFGLRLFCLSTGTFGLDITHKKVHVILYAKHFFTADYSKLIAKYKNLFTNLKTHMLYF